MQNLQRRTWVEVDLNCIEHNYNEIKRHTNAEICCVIKADAYGHGAVELALTYERLGASCFGVSNIDEALQLRKAGVKKPILIFGYVPATDVAILALNNISLCVYSLDYAKKLSAQCEKRDVNINIHIKVDTGMNRLGFYYQNPEQDFSAVDEIKEVCSLTNLVAEGIFSHFSSADEGEDDFTNAQLNCFNSILRELKEIKFKYTHCANSAAIEDFPNSHFDMVRAGIILYGLLPSTEIRNKFDLKPALSLKSVVSHVKKIKAGAYVSYGRDFKAEKDMFVATVPIGYADGFTRVLANGATLIVNGKRCEILGRVCMDQLVINLGDMRAVKTGDIVTIIGTDAKETITAEEIAKIRGTINYEVICDIGARVPRVYIKDGKEVAMLNYILG